MILGTKARYAVTAMVDLALTEADGKPQSLHHIAKRQELPLAYLEQLFPKLRNAGLVTSVRGPGGGYRLAHKTQDIRMLDVIEAVDESLEMTRSSVQSHPGCMAASGRILSHRLWQGLGRQISEYLHEMTLAELVEGK